MSDGGQGAVRVDNIGGGGDEAKAARHSVRIVPQFAA